MLESEFYIGILTYIHQSKNRQYFQLTIFKICFKIKDQGRLLPTPVRASTGFDRGFEVGEAIRR